MDAIISLILAPVAVPPALLVVGGVAIGLLFFALGRRRGQTQEVGTQEALGREMRRMRRQNVLLSEERDQLREISDRQRRSSQRTRTSEGAH